MTAILEILQNVADLGGLPRPDSAVNSADNTARQLIAIANVRGLEMSRLYPWPGLVVTGSLTLVAGAEQTLPEDCAEVLSDTAWYAGYMTPLNGPITPQEWQRQTQTVQAAQRFSFIRSANSSGNLGISVNPVATGGEVINYLYKSKNWVRPKLWTSGMSVASGSLCYSDSIIWRSSAAGTAGATAPTNANGGNDGSLVWAPQTGALYDQITADTDEPLVDARILKLGILATFYRFKGWEHQDLEAQFYREMRDVFAEQNGGRSFNMFSHRAQFIGPANYKEGNY
jgi:hypothetical protein